MTTIMPEEKRLQEALKWISSRQGEKDIVSLIQDASFKFNLTPNNEEYLYRLLREGDSGEES